MLPLTDAVAALPLAGESRDSYTRDAFRHWNAGADLTDGCNTSGEVLLTEAGIALALSMTRSSVSRAVREALPASNIDGLGQQPGADR